jgi:hypothetical protein
MICHKQPPSLLLVKEPLGSIIFSGKGSNLGYVSPGVDLAKQVLVSEDVAIDLPMV